MTMLVNHSKNRPEKADKKKCPRCSGFGGCFPQDTMNDKGECFLCKGIGEVWISRNESGWTRPLYGRIGESEQLW